jgi:GNAT superfamily N-acetyltransferase
MMFLKEVISAADQKEFIRLPVRLYRHVPQWIRPLDADIESVFDPKKNKTLLHGECIRYLLKSGKGEIIGRVAAFINHKTVSKGNDQPTGGIGFFECIENREAAFLLFDQCKQWLQERGMEAMDGPINFGNRDRWWGLLLEGFDREPNYQCNYNFPYYQNLFEEYGFQVYFYQLTFGRPIEGPIDERLLEKSILVERDPNYRFDYVRKKDWDTLPEKIRTVYNKAWAKRGEIPELTEVQARHLVKQMKPIMDERLLWFGYYHDEPIAFFLSLPEVNQFFKFVNGKMNLPGKLKFVWHRWRNTNKKAYGVLFGIVPAHQGKGVDGAIIETFRKFAHGGGIPYTEYEMNWIGDFNPKMIRVVEQINAKVVKKHATYRKLFDPSRPFKRMPILY